MTGWVDTDQVIEYVRSNLTIANSAPMAEHWATVCERAALRAYGDIRSAFAARGYTKAQVDTWDRGAEFQLDLAAWHAMTRIVALQPDVFGKVALDTLDRRPELWGDPTKRIEPVPLTATVGGVEGVAVEPEGTRGQVTTGALDTDDDLFSLDPDDSRVGAPTRL